MTETARKFPEEQADLRLLAIHAHPDDETLATGALLATWTRAGLHAGVITCTRGEQGEVIAPELAHLEGRGVELAEVRTAELESALAELGVTEHHFLDTVAPGGPLVDSGMQWVAPGIAGPADSSGPRAFATVAVEDSAARLALFIDDFQPDVVVTYDPDGGYGHPDHIQAHAVTVRALELVRVSPTVLNTVIPLDVALESHDALRKSPEVDELLDRNPHLQWDALYANDIQPEQLPPAVQATRSTLLQVDASRVADPLRAAMRTYSTQIMAVTELRHVPGLIGCAALSNRIIFPIPTSEFHEVITRGPRLAEIDKIPGLRIVQGLG